MHQAIAAERSGASKLCGHKSRHPLPQAQGGQAQGHPAPAGATTAPPASSGNSGGGLVAVQLVGDGAPGKQDGVADLVRTAVGRLG